MSEQDSRVSELVKSLRGHLRIINTKEYNYTVSSFADCCGAKVFLKEGLLHGVAGYLEHKDKILSGNQYYKEWAYPYYLEKAHEKNLGLLPLCLFCETEMEKVEEILEKYEIKEYNLVSIENSFLVWKDQ